jgi:hypothetical protein
LGPNKARWASKKNMHRIFGRKLSWGYRDIEAKFCKMVQVQSRLPGRIRETALREFRFKMYGFLADCLAYICLK